MHSGGDRSGNRCSGAAKYFAGGLATLAILAAAATAVILSGAYDVAATQPHNGLTHWILTTAMRHSVANRAT